MSEASQSVSELISAPREELIDWNVTCAPKMSTEQLKGDIATDEC